jgi:hypothetical protein
MKKAKKTASADTIHKVSLTAGLHALSVIRENVKEKTKCMCWHEKRFDSQRGKTKAMVIWNGSSADPAPRYRDMSIVPDPLRW